MICIASTAITQNLNADLLDNRFQTREAPNLISVHVEGGNYTSADNLCIYFLEGATFGYDVEFEMVKWYSNNSDATMIWSIAEDGTELSVNALPISCLYDGMTSIPIHFQCGYDEEYTLTFGGMDDFEFPTEFWLEDLCTEADWFSVNRDNDTYTFSGCVSDSSINRFMMHFLDPTSIKTNPQIESGIEIYSFGNEVFIKNKFDEKIKYIYTYDLMGREIYKGNARQQTLNKIKVANSTAYYVVKVLTDKNTYSQKVFINNY